MKGLAKHEAFNRKNCLISSKSLQAPHFPSHLFLEMKEPSFCRKGVNFLQRKEATQCHSIHTLVALFASSMDLIFSSPVLPKVLRAFMGRWSLSNSLFPSRGVCFLSVLCFIFLPLSGVHSLPGCPVIDKVL